MRNSYQELSWSLQGCMLPDSTQFKVISHMKASKVGDYNVTSINILYKYFWIKYNSLLWYIQPSDRVARQDQILMKIIKWGSHLTSPHIVMSIKLIRSHFHKNIPERWSLVQWLVFDLFNQKSGGLNNCQSSYLARQMVEPRFQAPSYRILHLIICVWFMENTC